MTTIADSERGTGSGGAATGRSAAPSRAVEIRRAASFAERSGLSFVRTVGVHGDDAKNPGKVKGWQHTAKPVTADEYARVLERGRANWYVVPNLDEPEVVIHDFDSAKGDDGVVISPAELATVERVLAHYDLPADSLRVRTPRQGYHVYMRAPDGYNGPGEIEYDQDGTFGNKAPLGVVAPGSITDDGSYAFDCPEGTRIEPASAESMQRLLADRAKAADTGTALDANGKVPNGSRHEYLFEAIREEIAFGRTLDECLAEGQRLNREVFVSPQTDTEIEYQVRAIFESPKARRPLVHAKDGHVILLTGKRLFEQADAAIEALADLLDGDSDPRVAIRGAELVRMTERGELEPLSTYALVDELSRAAAFVKLNEKGKEYEVAPPVALANLVLARDLKDYRRLPRVEYVVDAPVVTQAGTLVTTPGYDPETEIWYRPAPGLGEVTLDSSRWQNALAYLERELLADFGFVEQADRANALALMLTPALLPYIAAPTPLHPVIGGEPGIGKTLLAQVLLAPTCGLVPPQPEVGDPEEWRKNITTQLLAGVPAVLLDNLKKTLDSGALAAALTSATWRDRMLGANRLVTVPVRNAWVATANNLELSDELARRSVPIYLDSGDVKPSDRKKSEFRHPDLLGWVLERRAEVLRAVLTLVAVWLESKRPVVEAPPLGSFDRWHATVGGVLQVVGVEGFLGNLDKIRVENVDDVVEQMSAFVYEWHLLDLEPLDVKALATLADYGQPLHEHLPESAQLADTSRRTVALGYLLRAYRGHNFSGLRITHDGGSGHHQRKRWYVKGPASSGDASGGT